MVFFLAWTNFDLFEMKKHEKRATETGQLFDPDKEIPGQLKEEFPVHAHGRVRDLGCTDCHTCRSDICDDGLDRLFSRRIDEYLVDF